jgi:hypothetical protein
MLIAYNLPGDTLGKGIAGSPFLGISVQVLAFCTLWHDLRFIAFYWLLPFSLNHAAMSFLSSAAYVTACHSPLRFRF